MKKVLGYKFLLSLPAVVASCCLTACGDDEPKVRINSPPSTLLMLHSQLTFSLPPM